MNRKRICRAFFLVAVLMTGFLVAPVVGQVQWPEFRGPAGNGSAIGANLPLTINDETVKWKTPIHDKGWSSPVVWDDQIWLTTATEDGKKMYAICVHFESGKILRDILLHENESPAFCHPTNSYASPTPAIEEGRVYIHFGSYGTSCLDTKTGETIWQRKDLECDHFRGPASSPILFENLLIVAFDGFDHQYVVALDKETGDTVWKTDREIDYGTDNGDLMKAYCTGAIFQVEGNPILVYPSAVATIAYDPKTGKSIWTVYHEGMNASARPVISHNGLVILNNGMGRMDAVDPRGSGNITETNVSWTLTKSVAKRPSLLVISDRVYMVSDKGIVSCIDPTTGQPVWQKRIGGAFAASPIFDGEKVLAFSERGEIHVFKPGDKYVELAKSKLGDGFKASPAVVGDDLILRSFSHLYRIAN